MAGIGYSSYGYIITLPFVFHYDYEYISLAFLLAEKQQATQYTIFYDPQDCHRVKHFLYLYHKVYKERLSEVSFVGLSVSQDTESLLSMTTTYP